MSFVLQNVALLVAGPANKSIDNVFGTWNFLSVFGVDGITINIQQIFVAHRDDPAADRPDLVRPDHAAGPGDAGDGPGSRHGRA